jgi:putative NADH-flavin reductase
MLVHDWYTRPNNAVIVPNASPAAGIAIAVVGATGYVGGHIVVEALRRGHTVLGLSRTPTTGSPHGVTIQTGSIENIALVESLARETSTLIVAVPASLSGNPKLPSIMPELLDVVSRCSCRLGIVGGAGSLLTTLDGPRLVDTPAFPQAAKSEAFVQIDVLNQLRNSTSSADWFYLSPAAKFGSHSPGIRTGTYRVGEDVLLRDENGESAISGDDYAIALIDEVEHPAHHRQRFSVAN